MNMFRSILALSALVATVAVARPAFPTQIPNGNTNSCSNCHTGAPNGGNLNAFGSDVRAAGGGTSASWANVCDDDSDGDGQSNGLELGDPDCVWTVGATPAATTDISRPGDDASTTARGPAEGEGEGAAEGEGEAAGEGEGEGETGDCSARGCLDGCGRLGGRASSSSLVNEHDVRRKPLHLQGLFCIERITGSWLAEHCAAW
jgi:hypothetical protein